MIRTAPREWLDLLGEWARPIDRMSHVDIWWDPEVERWLLVDMVPQAIVPPEILAALRNDPLRTPFRARQSETWRETGKVPFAFWIVQGDQGGHKLEYTPLEAELAQWYGGSRVPPRPGSLPYAPVDERVVKALRGLDWLKSKYRDYEAAAEGNGQEALRQMRADMIERTKERLSDTIAEAAPALLAADLPVSDTIPDYDGETARFIETGVTEAPAGRSTKGPSVTVKLPR